MGIGALNTLSIAADGLTAQRKKMDAVAENIAHAQTTRTAEGGPYRRQRVQFSGGTSTSSFTRSLDRAQLAMKRSRSGHRELGASWNMHRQNAKPSVVADIAVDPLENSKMIYDPTHPDADIDGYVAMPNVEVIIEMVELMSAQRAYEANLTTIEAIKSMVQRSLDI